MDSTSLGVIGHPVVAALDAVGEALDAAATAEVWSLSDDDLQATIVACEVLAARQAAMSLWLLREAEARDLGRRLGASSMTAWLRHRLRLRPAEAKMRVDLAHRLRIGEPDDGPIDFAANVASAAGSRSMPATAAALAEGDVSLEHAGVIARTMVDLPGGLSSEQERIAETNLASWARVHDPVTVGRLGRHLIHALDTATLEEREQRAFQRRDLRFSDTADGSTRLSGRLDAESAAMVRAALDPLAAPNPGPDGERDPRTAGQRTADALVELCRRANDGALPVGHGVRPHLSVIITLDSLVAKATDDGGGNGAGRFAAGRLGCGWAPSAPGELGWGGPLSAEAIRRIACDAGVTRVITDPASVPLDVGRESRTVTAGQWAALVTRDRGCAFPGCTRPSEWCIAHHIVHWADGGSTDLDNLVLLCGYHHRVIHHQGWQVTMAADRHPEFRPPPWVDPDEAPRRNTRPRYEQRSPAP
ncbi:MAG: DUF222 domain-containing protein [Jiangellaceae bacterium]